MAMDSDGKFRIKNPIRMIPVKKAILLLLLLALFALACFRGRDIPFVSVQERWSIGIYAGNSFGNLLGQPHNPVLTSPDVTDIRASFLADPFMVYENGTWYMFFEAMNSDTKQGDIGLATSKDGFNWAYQRIVLDEPFHLSYPYVFKSDGDYYMVPESNEDSSIRLYKAENFPENWTLVKKIMDNVTFVDSSVFYANDGWWMLSSANDSDDLHLFHADSLTSQWSEHPKSPVAVGNSISRPAGRVLVFEDRIFRFAQDDKAKYGTSVRAFEITELNATEYQERELGKDPILEASGLNVDWNGMLMHQVDAHIVNNSFWIASVDGYGKWIVLGQ